MLFGNMKGRDVTRLHNELRGQRLQQGQNGTFFWCGMTPWSKTC